MKLSTAITHSSGIADCVTLATNACSKPVLSKSSIKKKMQNTSRKSRHSTARIKTSAIWTGRRQSLSSSPVASTVMPKAAQAESLKVIISTNAIKIGVNESRKSKRSLRF